MSFFQSYLITGSSDSRQKTESILKTLGITIKKSSPDIYTISPLKNSISIDKIRELKKHINQKPLCLKYKIIIIEETEKLTLEAQNSLLKILEEPPSHALFFLETPNKDKILPTILSRVIIKKTNQKTPDKDQTKLLSQNPEDLLEEIGQTENPLIWLDEEIITLQKILKEKIMGKNRPYTNPQLIKTIEECLKTKKMIAANVNPKFALANLIFSTRSAR